MNLAEIKSKLNISTLELNTAKDSNHKELVAEIKSDSNMNSLGLQSETREGEQGSYTAYRIVKYKPAETTL
jgi:hypothetical protein